MHNFTPEEILLYLYKECPAEVAASLEAEMEKNWSLREKLLVMKTAMERLDAITVTPRTEAVLNVLRHARESRPATIRR